jgi:Dolichyl-phosphate-mannose-protein mannosyltransferase
MTGSLGGLLAANVLYLAVGVGLMPLLRIAPTRDDLVRRAGLSYLVGVAATGILAATLALVRIPLGLAELAFVAALVLLLGLRRLPQTAAAVHEPTEPLWSRIVGAAALLLAGVLLVHAARTFRIRPLLEWDGWAIWAMKARGLYELGGAESPVFTSESYPPLQHPLWLPSLEAIDFRAMSAFDGTLIHLQLLFLALGFLAAYWTLLRGVASDALLGVVVLAILAAEPVLKQLSTNLADVPLAFLVALGIAALARWVAADERWALVCAALFLGAATLTKSEGALFALAAFAAALPTARGRLRPLLWAGLAVALMLLPWRVFVAAHDLPVADYDIANLVDPSYLADNADRVRPAADGLLSEIFSSDWGLLVPLFLVALAAAVLVRRYALAAYAGTWAILSFGGLLAIYWISVVPLELQLVWTADRTIVTIVVGGAALAPLLASRSPRRSDSGA